MLFCFVQLAPKLGLEHKLSFENFPFILKHSDSVANLQAPSCRMHAPLNWLAPIARHSHSVSTSLKSFLNPKKAESFSQLFSVSNLVFFPKTQHPFWHSLTSQALLSSHTPPSLLHFSHGELVVHNPSFSSIQHPILQLAT